MWNISVLCMGEKSEMRSPIRLNPRSTRFKREMRSPCITSAFNKKRNMHVAHLPLHDLDPKKYRMQFWKRVESDRPFSLVLVCPESLRPEICCHELLSSPQASAQPPELLSSSIMPPILISSYRHLPSFFSSHGASVSRDSLVASLHRGRRCVHHVCQGCRHLHCPHGSHRPTTTSTWASSPYH
jgi:hypothetical protein